MFLHKYKMLLHIVLVLALCGPLLIKSDQLSEAEIENVLKTLLEPGENPPLQIQALRRDILRKLEDAVERQNIEDEFNEYKRSMSSLARWNNLPDKRNLEALARAGYIKTLPEEEEENESLKRSIAALARNGQLPHLQEEETKRGIESLARNGELPNKREMQELIDELYEKRNVGSLARYSNFPSYGKRFLGSLARSNDLVRYTDKRNIASLARDGMKLNGKRNVAALLRQDSYLNGRDFRSDSGSTDKPSDNSEMDKRNIASIKAQYKPKFKRDAGEGKKVSAGARTKRQIDYYDGLNDEYPQPVLQNQNIYDYEDLMNILTGAYPEAEKRFLGSVARSGWFRNPNSNNNKYMEISKRHIGSLARLGWLPSFRSARRFNRSGRSTAFYYECPNDRSIAADGEDEDYAASENSLPINEKRLLLQPALDRIIFKKLFTHPRQTANFQSNNY